MKKRTFKKCLFSLILPATLICSPIFADTVNLAQKPFWDNLAQKPYWDIGVQALYLKPSFSDGFAYLDDTRINDTTDKRNPLETDWGWGFKIEGSYHFCPNSDFNINWYHYKKTAKGTFVFLDNPTEDNYRVTPNWDAVNLEYGHSIHFDQVKNLRIHGGLQFAQLKTTYHGEGTDTITGPGEENDKLRYNGVGPRLGLDLYVGNDLSAYFGGDIAMLVGRSKFDFNETFEPFTVSGSRPTVVVPEIGLKIGARYNYAMPCGNLLFDAGYMFVNYFDALHLRDDFTASETNFALNGFYAGVKLEIG